MKKLIDQYGRRINYLRISVTDRCNLRCIYCIPNANILFKHRRDILSYEEIIKIVKVGTSLGINKIRLTGGEPLLRKNIDYLISALSKIEGIDEISLTTNGIFLEEYAEDLKKAGLKRINISLDTLKREKYKLITGTESLNKVLAGIDKALTIGLSPVKINVVVMKGINDDEVVEFAELTLKEPLHIRFIELMPIGSTLQNWKERFISNDEVKNLVGSVFDRAKNKKGTVSFISPISEPFCHNCSRLRLTSDGKLRFCLDSSQEIDLIPIISDNKFSFDGLKQAFISASKLKPKSHNFFNIASGVAVAMQIPGRMSMCQIGG
jgi:cyclic pyranopterin phosphate synthase